MRKLYNILMILLPFCLFSEELEVHLKPSVELPSLYISLVQTDVTSYDWRYLDELRSILEFDLSVSGKCSLLPPKPEWDEKLPIHDHRKHFNLTFWKNQSIPFILVLEATKQRLRVTAFHITKDGSKSYPDLLLTNDLSKDRLAIHHLANCLQKDLFQARGISSSKLIYTQRTKNDASAWQSEIWVCDADGANAKQLTKGQNYCLTPFFFPTPVEDGDFFFVAHQEGQSKIYKARFNDPTPIPMISLRGNQLLPSLSAKATHLAFISDVAGRPDLFVQSFNQKGEAIGKARQLFSAPRATQASPTFSPNGREVAFVSDKDGPPRIYVLPLVSSSNTQKINPRLITRKNRENTSPSWSPDGKKIAYSAKVDGVRQIWLYDIEKEEEIQLTTGPAHKENPSWAPNSFHLVYNTETEDSCELYLINVTNQTPVLLTKGPGQKRFASWDRF
ncbi:MAG: Tol-Pal system protein TolB [Chlamydiales bacterium]|nr:Tol-Pal system protein TolB [Chlamydiales bacterium]